MSLANLSINVNVNAAQAVGGLRDVASAAQQGMGDSTAAVDDFRANLMRASAELNTAAQRMGSGMQAANDSIMQSSAEAGNAVDGIQESVDKIKFDSVSQKAAYAFGAGFAAAKTASEAAVDWVENKLKIIAISAITGIAVATIALGVAAYKAASFINGLFTGEAYKSDNIDAVIAMNNEVKSLQNTLQLSANDAHALRDALGRLGVSKVDYTEAFTNASKAMRVNTDELERLGVKYKGLDGKLLDTVTVLQNAKDKLDEYSAGYDRNAAAVAIGMGSYDQITDTLKVTNNEIQNSKERLHEYGLLIGPGTQAYVAEYEQAMREFKNETELTSQGFKRAVSDAIMPALTSLAVWFKEGFPSIVAVFRGFTASVATGFYMLKDGIYVIAESIITVASSIGRVLGGVGEAFIRLLQGDFSGASQAFSQGLESAKQRISLGGDNIVAQINSNNAAIKQAWGNLTGLNPNDGAAMDGADGNGKKGKPWVPKPKVEAPKAPAAEAKSAYDSYIQELDRTIKKMDESEFASMRLKAEQLAEKEGIKDLTKAYERINQVQRLGSQKVVDSFAKQVNEETSAYKFQTSIMALNKNEQEDLNFARTKYLATEKMIDAAQQSGKPLDAQAINDLRTKTRETIALMQAQINERRELEKKPEYGALKALQEYQDKAADVASQTKDLFSNSFKGMEDALVNFVMTGKFSFKDLAKSILAELTRMIIKQMMFNLLASIFGSFGGGGKIMSAGSGTGGSSGGLNFGSIDGARAAGGPVNKNGTYMVGEKGPELFIPSDSGTILPNGVMPRSSGGGGSTNVFNINTAGVSHAELTEGVNNSRLQAASDMRQNRLRRRA